jgi:N-acetylmuramoyl-L-alanine amidase
MRIALDIGHMGKRSSPNDRGAINSNYREASLSLKYATSAWHELEKLGHTTFLLCYDNYSTRQAFCDVVKADAHIQCHLNAAGGKYALVAYREDAHLDSAKLGATVSHKLETALGDVISKVEVRILRAENKEKGIKEDRGYLCLKENIPSLLFEPLFIDNEDHLQFMLQENGLEKIGIALATAVDEWGKATNR